jgi:hypothetical protein
MDTAGRLAEQRSSRLTDREKLPSRLAYVSAAVRPATRREARGVE